MNFGEKFQVKGNCVLEYSRFYKNLRYCGGYMERKTCISIIVLFII